MLVLQLSVLRFQYHINARGIRTNFLQQFCHMRTDFYKKNTKLVAKKIPKLLNLLHHCCEHAKSSSSDVLTNYLIFFFT